MRRESTIRIAVAMIAACMFVACAQPGGISVEGAFARPAPTVGGNGGVFLTIVNRGQADDRLVSASSPASQVVELHETTNEDGVMKMRPQPDGFLVRAGESLQLKPGGKHVMLIGLKAPLAAGDQVDLTLKFEKAGTLVVQVPVQD